MIVNTDAAPLNPNNAAFANEITKIKETGLGYNAKTEKFEDLIKTGILDPAKVTRTALENAASVAGLILTTECIIKKKETR